VEPIQLVPAPPHSSFCFLVSPRVSHQSLLSSIFRTLFQVPYPATSLFAALTQTPGVCGVFFPFRNSPPALADRGVRSASSTKGDHRRSPARSKGSRLPSRVVHASTFFGYSQQVLTLFTTAKPFRGHIGIIQRNAMKSWTRLRADIEIILFGNDEGAAEVARELGVRHEAHVECNELGTKRLDYLFARAQAVARHNVLCYVNCDIILMQDFWRAIERVRGAHKEFLIVGRRWDTDITEPLPFDQHAGQSEHRQAAHWETRERQAPDWQEELRTLALRRGRQRTAEWIDYFVFSRGLYGADIPPFALRVFWDNWLVWKALDSQKPVVDASRVVMAVHQNHDYSHHPQGKEGVWNGAEAGRNAQLAGGWRHLRTIADATQMLHEDGLHENTKRYWSAARRFLRQGGRVLLYDVWHPLWFALLNVSRPLRRALHPRPPSSS